MAGSIFIGMAYGVSALLTGGDVASDTVDTGRLLAKGLLLWIGAPIVLVAARWHTQSFHHVLAEQSYVETGANACDRPVLISSV